LAEPALQRRVDRELNRLSETPRHPGGIRLQSGDELYRVRIGDLRLLFSLEDQILLVLIVKIGQRGSMYRA
jgi:mRNA interferase RelE/StbE